MKRVIVESPFGGDVPKNLRYLRACLRDCVLRGETPYASHGLLTQPGVLRDDVPEEREVGINAGFVWRQAADLTVIYVDLGISGGMYLGIEDAMKLGQPIDTRILGKNWDNEIPGEEIFSSLWRESLSRPV